MRIYTPLWFFITCMIYVQNVQAGNGYVYAADKSQLFYIQENEIYSPDKSELLYFNKGNIFFAGTTDDRNNIYLMATSLDITTAKQQKVYEASNRVASYTFSNGKFYIGEPDDDDAKAKAELLHVERAGKWMAFYATENDSLIGYYLADSIMPANAVLVAYTLIKKYNVQPKPALVATPVSSQNQNEVTLKPIWGNISANEWVWDGQVLHPRWNVDPRLAWTYDGQTIKPYYSTNIYEQYQWDGETFKPLWRTSRGQEWTWDGHILKPIWDTDWANQYLIEDGKVKPWSNVHPEHEWQLSGDMPIPLIILIISGIAGQH